MRDPTAADVEDLGNRRRSWLTGRRRVRRQHSTIEPLQRPHRMVVYVVDESGVGVKIGCGRIVVRDEVSLGERKDGREGGGAVGCEDAVR